MPSPRMRTEWRLKKRPKRHPIARRPTRSYGWTGDKVPSLRRQLSIDEHRRDVCWTRSGETRVFPQLRIQDTYFCQGCGISFVIHEGDAQLRLKTGQQ